MMVCFKWVKKKKERPGTGFMKQYFNLEFPVRNSGRIHLAKVHWNLCTWWHSGTQPMANRFLFAFLFSIFAWCAVFCVNTKQLSFFFYSNPLIYAKFTYTARCIRFISKRERDGWPVIPHLSFTYRTEIVRRRSVVTNPDPGAPSSVQVTSPAKI